MTENNQNLVPEIRFNGFTNAWEQRELGDVVKMVGGATPSKANKAYWDGEIVWLSSQEIKDRYVSAGTYKITEKAVRESATKVVPAFTPLIVSRSGILARKFPITLPTVDVAINQDIKALFFDSEILDTDFFVSQLEMKESTILTSIVKTGTTVQSVNMPDFEKLVISIPSIREQQKIGKIFYELDNLITLHKRKLDGLRALKKGYLQQMFPQAGERVPRVRFARFSGDWQERKLGELYKERNERSSEGELISVTINSGVIKASELERKDNSSEDKSNYKKVEVGDIAYNSMRMWQGASGISNYAGILSPAYTVIIPNEGVDSLFFSYMFKLTRMIEIFQSFSQGLTSDTWNLKFPQLKEIFVTVPCSNEQAAISDFFRIIDEQITDQAIKLKQLGQLKEAYLQRMFI